MIVVVMLLLGIVWTGLISLSIGRNGCRCGDDEEGKSGR